MFELFANKKKTDITLFDETGAVIYQGDINELPLQEQLIIDGCIEFYNDAHPCFIHRSAVRTRFIFELEDGLRQLSGADNTMLNWFELSPRIQQILTGEKTVKMLTISWSKTTGGLGNSD